MAGAASYCRPLCKGVAAFQFSLNYAGPNAALIHAARDSDTTVESYFESTWWRLGVMTLGWHQRALNQKSMTNTSRAAESLVRVTPRTMRAIRFLLELDKYVTGQAIVVDGSLALRRD